jgi:hypothetical protein
VLPLTPVWQLAFAAAVHASRSTHDGFVPVVDVQPAPHAHVHPLPLAAHVPRPAPHGFEVGLHAFTHVAPLDWNPESHLQL